MKILTKVLLLLLVVSLYKIDAQYVVKKDTLSGNVLNITMDSRIDNIMTKQEDACARPKEVIGSTPNRDKDVTKITVPSKNLSNSDICKQNPKIMGYKIQVALVKSNEDARKTGTDFRKSFPYLKVEIDASLRPNYKVLAGSYFTKQSAASDLAKIKSNFGSATTVQYRIFCVEAK